MRASIDEESKQLLRRIVEAMARRQLSSINILGHCLKYVEELDTKVSVASELDLSLRLFREVHTLYRDLGWTDLDSVVRDRLDEVPYPSSRLEFGLSYYLFGIAEGVAMRSYLDSSCAEFAAIARSHVEAAERRPEPARFSQYCEDPAHRPQAQQFLDRWHSIALSSFGRPGSASDARAVELELRSQTSDAMRAEFVASCEPFVRSCGLVVPVEEDLEAER